MLVISQDVEATTLSEIGDMIETHGDCCIAHLEDKFSVLIMGDSRQVEVYQLPEGEVYQLPEGEV